MHFPAHNISPLCTLFLISVYAEINIMAEYFSTDIKKARAISDLLGVSLGGINAW
jgi:hypothetical protein